MTMIDQELSLDRLNEMSGGKDPFVHGPVTPSQVRHDLQNRLNDLWNAPSIEATTSLFNSRALFTGRE
jgi:hypothetical protein